MLGQAGNRERARDRTEREHELVVAELERAGVRRLDAREPPLLVDRGHAAEHELGVRAHLAERDDVCRGSSVPEAASGSIGV